MREPLNARVLAPCLALGLALATLAGCTPASDPANPALWEISGPHGAHGWLFGTIHALPRPARWRTAPVQAALAGSDTLVVEIAALNDSAAMAHSFQTLSHHPGEPPLSERVSPGLRPALSLLEAKAGVKDRDFSETETWAAALILEQATDDAHNSAQAAANGVDRALLREVGAKPVVELEGAARQLGLFHSLPQESQRALLAAVLRGANTASSDAHRLAEAWRRGDIGVIEQETRSGMLVDPQLRQVLFVGRNRAWATDIAALLAAGRHPFVAVGAAHMAGPQGLPALLARQGYTIRRVQ